jgi:hypothetical protein
LFINRFLGDATQGQHERLSPPIPKKKSDERNGTTTVTSTVTSFLHVAPPAYKVVELQHEVSDSEEKFYGFEQTASIAAADTIGCASRAREYYECGGSHDM